MATGMPEQKSIGQEKNVVPAFPQRRNRNRKYVQPVVQVLPEIPFSTSSVKSLLVVARTRTFT